MIQWRRRRGNNRRREKKNVLDFFFPQNYSLVLFDCSNDTIDSVSFEL